jgi:hypothetical protein
MIQRLCCLFLEFGNYALTAAEIVDLATRYDAGRAWGIRVGASLEEPARIVA